VTADVLQFAGGNPLYAEEYARMLADRGLAQSALPETVQWIIAARLEIAGGGRRPQSRTPRFESDEERPDGDAPRPRLSPPSA
jgi:hypothetical protein